MWREEGRGEGSVERALLIDIGQEKRSLVRRLDEYRKGFKVRLSSANIIFYPFGCAFDTNAVCIRTSTILQPSYGSPDFITPQLISYPPLHCSVSLP